MIKPKQCPFCGTLPEVDPKRCYPPRKEVI